MTVDFSSTLSDVFNFLKNCLFDIVDKLDSIYIFPHVSILRFFIAAVIIGMIISAVFVLFDGGVEVEE